jgi:hypothetical protein
LDKVFLDANVLFSAAYTPDSRLLETGTRIGQLPEDVQLAEKDVPILLAAVDSGFTHLLTGDKRRFNTLYGKRVGGVLVQTPAQYLKSRDI